MGRPGVAVDFISDHQKLENQKKIIQELIKILNSDTVFRFQYVKATSKTPDPKIVLETWILYFRNILLKKLNGSENLKQYSLIKLRNILKIIQNTHFLISTTNINPRLALEILILEL